MSPLRGLHFTLFRSRGLARNRRYAHGYYHFPRKPLIDVTGVSPTLAWAAGGIVSTVADLAQFYRALLGGRVLTPDLLHAMETTTSMGVVGEDYGLGLWETRTLGFARTFRLSCAADRVWGHDGDFPGYLTYAFNSADGQRFLINTIVGEEKQPITVVVNWQAALKR